MNDREFFPGWETDEPNSNMTKGDVDRYMQKNFDRLADEWWARKIREDNLKTFLKEAGFYDRMVSEIDFDKEQARIEGLWKSTFSGSKGETPAEGEVFWEYVGHGRGADRAYCWRKDDKSDQSFWRDVTDQF